MRVFSKLSKHRLKLFGGNKSTQPSSGKQRVLFVSHEATRTGAPMIILNILRHFHQHCDIQCETILHNGGQLVAEFASVSTVDCLNLPRQAGDELKNKVSKIISRERGNRPTIAICNSMESRHIAEEIASHDIPIIFLVHELPSSYSEEDYENVFRYSDQVVFPAQAVREAAKQKTSLPESKINVLPQGLLKPQFGQGISREVAREQIRKELRLPAESFIVLGCGTLDLRKGIDHFANIARETLKQNSQPEPIHFVWLGEGPRWTHSPFHYVKLDLETSGCSPFVHFIGERANVEPFFMGSDVFLMSSRVDPFPCVIHEAMAAGIPIITFAQNGGASEAIAGGCGLAVPYGNYVETANSIRLLKNQPEIANAIRYASKERVQTKYKFSTYAEKLVELAEEIAKTKMLAKPRLYIENQAA